MDDPRLSILTRKMILKSSQNDHTHFSLKWICFKNLIIIPVLHNFPWIFIQYPSCKYLLFFLQVIWAYLKKNQRRLQIDTTSTSGKMRDKTKKIQEGHTTKTAPKFAVKKWRLPEKKVVGHISMRISGRPQIELFVINN